MRSTQDQQALAGRSFDTTGLMIAVAFSGAVALVSITRASNHWAGGLDLGLFDQAVWLLSRGRSPDVTFLDGNIFADHVSPVLLLFAPLYRIVASPVWLLIAQAAALGATVVPMRRVARSVGAPTWLATVATIGSAPLLAAGVFDFHPLAMTAPGVAWMLAGTLEDDERIALLALSWVFLCRADAAFVAVGIALLATRHLRWRLLILGAAGALIGLLTPHLFGEPRQTFDRYYDDLGDSPVDALLHPWRVFAAIADSSFWATLVIWLLPVFFLTVIRPRWLLVLLVGGSPLLLSSWPGVSQPWFHNGALMAPIAIGGALAAIAGIRRDLLRPVTGALLAGCAAALLTQSPLAPRAPAAVHIRTVLEPNGRNIDDTLALIPDDASVATVNQLAPPLAHRDEIYVLPCPFPELEESDDDEGIVDICGGRDARPTHVLAEERRRSGLEALGYDVEASPTPGIVLGTRPE